MFSLRLLSKRILRSEDCTLRIFQEFYLHFYDNFSIELEVLNPICLFSIYILCILLFVKLNLFWYDYAVLLLESFI